MKTGNAAEHRPIARTSQPGLPAALDAPLHELASDRIGRIAYYSDCSGAGRPLLLVHSINAAPSSYEVKPLFERWQGRRPVYSIDLPGFGHSERADRRYTPDLYAAAIVEVLTHVIGQPADVLALSLSAEFAARAALIAPEQVASLVLVSPTGFSARGLPPPRVGRVLHRVLSVPPWRQGLYDLVASRRSIRYFLNKSFNAQAPDGLIDYAYATAHQPGARHAPLYFLSTQLFTPGALDQLYAKLADRPVLAIADRDPYVSFERLAEFASGHPSWQYQTLAPHMGLPHWEQPAMTFDALQRFWDGVAP